MVVTMRQALFVLLWLLAGFVTLGTAYAGPDVNQQKSIKNGAAHYRIFCINCHGPKADGNGPMVHLMKIKPADLTVLRRNSRNGESIAEMVFKAVDGRHKVGEGEERKMPVFSDNLAVNTVIEIGDYLNSIQK